MAYRVTKEALKLAVREAARFFRFQAMDQRVEAPGLYKTDLSFLYGLLSARAKWPTKPAPGVYASMGFGDPRVDTHYVAMVIDGPAFELRWRDEWGAESKALTWDDDYAVSEHDYWILWLTDGFYLFIDGAFQDWIYAGKSPQAACPIVVRNDSPEGSLFEVSSIMVNDVDGIAIKKHEAVMVDLASIAGGATSTLAQCLNLDLRYVKSLAFTVECTYHAAATAGIRVHLRSSVDTVDFDTDDYASFNVPFRAGETVRYTVAVTPDPRHMKALVENLDPTYAVSDVKVIAVFGR